MAIAQRSHCHLRPRTTLQRRTLVCRCSQTSAAAPKTHERVQSLLKKCEGLGKCRFIVIGDGAILESVADFSAARYVDLPEPKGTLATFSSDDKTFECHLYLNKIAGMRLTRSKARTGNHDVYAIRFTDSADKVLLTTLLHGQAGTYEPAAVSAWEALRAEYGEEAKFT